MTSFNNHADSHYVADYLLNIFYAILCSGLSFIVFISTIWWLDCLEAYKSGPPCPEMKPVTFDLLMNPFNWLFGIILLTLIIRSCKKTGSRERQILFLWGLFVGSFIIVQLIYSLVL